MNILNMIIKTLTDLIKYDYENVKNHHISFHKMVDTLSKMLDTTTVQCIFMDGINENNIFFKDDVFYVNKWEIFFENNKMNENMEIFLLIRPMFEIQTVKNHHLYTFLSGNDKEMNEWTKDTIVWFDVVGNRIYSVRYTGYSDITEMFSIQIDKFIDELSENDCDNYNNYKDRVTIIAKERFQYIREGRVV